MYIHERKEWPNFTWDQHNLLNIIGEIRYLQGRLLGRMNELGFPMSQDATLQVLTQDVIKTSEIEGEKLDTDQVRSSIAKKLGIHLTVTPRVDRSVEGIVEVLLDATQHYDQPLTKKRLFNWHSALFPTGRSGLHVLMVGHWRINPMQVVSGYYGREKIHYEAPPHEQLNKEMTRFIQWFNKDSSVDLIIKSAIAHFWFVTIHPFDDGNGRIARAMADMLLARSEKSKQRFYSMSSQIQQERRSYYNTLEQCQKGRLDITPWIEWYVECLKHAILASEATLEVVLSKAKFWRIHSGEIFNERQRAMINRLFDGFNGKLNSSKWAKLTKCSQDTALRDINDLLERKVLIKDEAGGRSTSYQLLKNS